MRRLMVLAVLGVFVGLAVFGQGNPFGKKAVDWYGITMELQQELGIPVRDLSQDPIGLKDFLFLRFLGFNSRALETLWQEISIGGPISTLQRLTQVKYWASITSVKKLLLFFKFADQQEFLSKHPKYLVENVPESDYIFTLIMWHDEGRAQ